MIEPIRIEHGALVVIAQQHELGIHDKVDALARIRTVTDDVAQAINLSNSQRFNIRQHGLESLQITVDVANDRLHAKGLAIADGPTVGTGTVLISVV